MYNKKYTVEKIEQLNRYNPIYEDMEGCICYPVYFNVGERGWFLYEANVWDGWPHRVHTTVIKDVVYDEHGRIFVTTQNTKFVFKSCV